MNIGSMVGFGVVLKSIECIDGEGLSLSSRFPTSEVAFMNLEGKNLERSLSDCLSFSHIFGFCLNLF